MVAKKRGLGRGLDALLPRREAAPADDDVKRLAEIPLEFIRPGKYQPRTRFEADAITELSVSIRARGVMQPIVLRPLGKDSYEIIAGERRWRAAQQAGLEAIPAVVQSVDDESALAMSLIENIQREDLNPLEEARALTRLIDDFQFTHQEVADAVGKSRSSVTNTLRLTHLADPVAEMLMNREIEMGHARALLTLEKTEQAEVARIVVSKGLNVRQTEALVRKSGETDPGENKPIVDADTRRLEDRLSMTIGQPVAIKHAKSGRGKLTVSYNSLDELDGILAHLGYKE